MADRVKRYFDLCAAYSVRPCADVAVWLRLKIRSSSLIIHGKSADTKDRFADLDLFPLFDLLVEKEHADLLEALKLLDLSRCFVGRAGVRLLCDTILVGLPTCRINKLNLSKQRIGSTGARVLADAARANSHLEELILHNCMLKDAGGQIFAELLAETPQAHKLKHLDLSNNLITYATCVAIEKVPNVVVVDTSGETSALMDRGPDKTIVNTSGNRVLDEVLNAVSSGVGFIMAIIGAVFMGTAVHTKPSHYQWSVSLYLVSLILVFLATALYHSFFTLHTTRRIFFVIDRSAFFLLIAATYTPFIAILFPNKSMAGERLISIMWTLCILGISSTAFLRDTAKGTASTCLYLLMGWVATMSPVPNAWAAWTAWSWVGWLMSPVLLHMGHLVDLLTPNGFYLLVAGEVLCIIGFPFLVKNGRTFGIPDPTIWHMCFLAGCFANYLCILCYVVPFEPGALTHRA